MKSVNLRREAYTVYCGRAGKGQDGYFGNPYRVGARCTRCGQTHRDGGSTLACYKEYLLERLESDAEFAQRFDGLPADAVLACFCKPAPCHTDVMIAVWQARNGNKTL